MPTFANDKNGHIPLYYIAVTITSPSSSANFQQKVTINSNTNSSYYNSTLLNVNWQDGASNILNSWLESGETNSSTASVYWIKVPTASTTTIYQVIYGTSQTSIDGTVTGAEPNYTGSYGQYDNGANVFLNYTNFAGSSTPTGYSKITTNATLTQNNGIVNAVTGGVPNNSYGCVFTTSAVSDPCIDIKVTSSTNNTLGIAAIMVTGTAPTTGSYDQGLYTGYKFEYNFSNTSYKINRETAGSGAGLGNTTQSYSFPFILTGAWASTGVENVGYNYGFQPKTDSTNTWGNNYIGVWWGDVNNAADSVTVQWFRSRLYPPSGSMPTTSQGPATSTSVAPTLIYANYFSIRS